MARSLKNFGDELKTARQKSGMTQANLGQRVGVTASAVGNWERGEDEPDRARVTKLESTLGLDAGTLSQHLGYSPVGAADSMDLGSRVARLPRPARDFIKDYIDAEERRLGEKG